MMVHTCKPSIQEVEAEESRVQGQLGLHSEFEVSLVYKRHFNMQANKLK